MNTSRSPLWKPPWVCSLPARLCRKRGVMPVVQQWHTKLVLLGRAGGEDLASLLIGPGRGVRQWTHCITDHGSWQRVWLHPWALFPRERERERETGWEAKMRHAALRRGLSSLQASPLACPCGDCSLVGQAEPGADAHHRAGTFSTCRLRGCAPAHHVSATMRHSSRITPPPTFISVVHLRSIMSFRILELGTRHLSRLAE